MIEPSSTIRVATALVGLLAGSGCALGPDGRDGDAAKLVRSLRADNAKLKDSTLALKVQNQDLTQRAVDDARSIQALESANRQYEQSIQNYQDDREEYRAAFRDLKGQVGSGSPP